MSSKNFKVKEGLDVGGTVTATAFSGDGSGLTGLPSSSSVSNNCLFYLDSTDTSKIRMTQDFVSWISIKLDVTLRGDEQAVAANATGSKIFVATSSDQLRSFTPPEHINSRRAITTTLITLPGNETGMYAIKKVIFNGTKFGVIGVSFANNDVMFWKSTDSSGSSFGTGVVVGNLTYGFSDADFAYLNSRWIFIDSQVLDPTRIFTSSNDGASWSATYITINGAANAGWHAKIAYFKNRYVIKAVGFFDPNAGEGEGGSQSGIIYSPENNNSFNSWTYVSVGWTEYQSSTLKVVNSNLIALYHNGQNKIFFSNNVTSWTEATYLNTDSSNTTIGDGWGAKAIGVFNGELYTPGYRTVSASSYVSGTFPSLYQHAKGITPVDHWGYNTLGNIIVDGIGSKFSLEVDKQSITTEELTVISYNHPTKDATTFDGVYLGNNVGRSTYSPDSASLYRGVFVGNSAGRYAGATDSVAIGDQALMGSLTDPGLSAGGTSTAVGSKALTAVTSANYNTAVGYWALHVNTSGANNTAIGAMAGSGFSGNIKNVTGSNNIFIGYQANGTTTAISNQITLGNSSITSLRCQVTAISALSDVRDKTNIESIPVGLNFVNDLNPVKFEWNMRDGAKVGALEGGFIAQEVLSTENKFNTRDWLNVVLDDNPEKLEVAPAKLIPILVKAIQELSAEISILKNHITEGNL